MIGADVGLGGHLFYNLQRTRAEIQLRMHDVFISGIGKPVFAMGLLIVFAAHSRREAAPNLYLFASVLATTLAVSGGLLRYARRTVD